MSETVPENAFELGIHQIHIQRLHESGYAVRHRFFPGQPEGCNARYNAIVMPIRDYLATITILNIVNPRPHERPIDELPWELLERDIRFRRSDTAYDALIGSAEAAMLIDENPILRLLQTQGDEAQDYNVLLAVMN